MGWGVITGEERLLPSLGGANEIKLEAGKPKKVRLLLQPGQEPYSFFQHSLELEKIENGQTTTVYRTVNCPKTKSNPGAPCPLCDGQQARRRIRHSAPAWDYETNESRLLTNGEDVFKPMATLAKMGIDPSAQDWMVSRTGTGRNDTTYSAVNVGPGAFNLPEGTVIINPQEAYTPHTIDQMKEIVEAMGLVWADLIVPPPLQYPASLQEALDHVIPNTKYKNQTMKQVWDTNRGMIEFFSKSNRVSPEKAAAQVILVSLGGIPIPGVPNYSMGGAVINPATPVTPTYTPPAVNNPAPPAASTPSTPNPVTPTPAASTPDAGRQAKITEINNLFQSNKKFVDGGYGTIVEAMKTAGDGKISINEFTDAQLDKLIEICKQ